MYNKRGTLGYRVEGVPGRGCHAPQGYFIIQSTRYDISGGDSVMHEKATVEEGELVLSW